MDGVRARAWERFAFAFTYLERAEFGSINDDFYCRAFFPLV